MSGTCDSISGKTMMDKATITAQSVTLKVNKTDRNNSIISVDDAMKPVGSGTAGTVSASTPTARGTLNLTATIIYKNGKFLIDDASWGKCEYGYIRLLRTTFTLTYPIATSATEAEEKKIVTLGLLLEALGE